MNYWELASSGGKLLGLLAMAGVSGGAFSLALAERLRIPVSRLLQYISLSAVLGFIAAGLFFLIQVGAVNQSGLAGMFDVTMIGIFVQTDLGTSTAVRLFGFAVSAVAVSFLTGRVQAALLIASIALLAFSFTTTGHISALPVIAQFGLALHVLAMGAWIGALYPLLYLSKAGERRGIQQLMVLFGRLAVGVVGVLLATGIYLITRTLASVDELWTTSYGRTASLKFALVAGLLALAVLNKFVLVPRLQQSPHALQRSITSELVLACLILLATAWLTTNVGPGH